MYSSRKHRPHWQERPLHTIVISVAKSLPTHRPLPNNAIVTVNAIEDVALCSLWATSISSTSDDTFSERISGLPSPVYSFIEHMPTAKVEQITGRENIYWKHFSSSLTNDARV